MLTTLLYVAYAVVVLLLTAHAGITLAWAVYTWRSRHAHEAVGFPLTDTRRHRAFSLLVPARHEEAVLGDTLDRLAGLDYPEFEVLAIVGHDDHGTREVARSAAERHPDRIRVVVDESWPKNKPRALNTALFEVEGDVVGVFDAEDEVHPWLLRAVNHQMRATGADVVQAGVQLVNFWSNWYSVRNVLEYFFWFRSRLHLHADLGFIPLGGNTVFVDTGLLKRVGGWDGDCLTEDCDLGVRLSLKGARFAVAYDPELITREETPPSLGGWLKQRTRWNQGFLQVLDKGDWRRLPTRSRRLFAWYTLANPFIQAATGLLIPVAIATMIIGGFPVWLAVLTLLPAIPTLATLVVEMVALGDFGDSVGYRVRPRDYLRLFWGSFAYQVLLGVAAVRAAWRHRRGDDGWEKTEHAGAHRHGTEKVTGTARA
jgi:cellulose synthase/poly-beta-1,6-N-acetylglucosamine synthase-like glycosyltransferase